MEDLLKILDGEPLDAGLKTAMLADPTVRAELEQLRSRRARLQALPALQPGSDLWPDVRAAAETVREPRRLRVRSVVLGLAAGLALLALGLRLSSIGQSEREPQATLGTPAAALTPELREESARLERLLSALPRQPRVMTAATAGTIAGLEDHVASIDQRLSLAAAGRMELAYREALWRERVDVMTALVQVRYAQAQDLGR